MPVNIGVNIQRSPNRINQQLREAGVEGKFPKLLLDFKDQYYLASGGSKTLANAVTHARSGNATMTDGYGPELVTNGTFDTDSDWTDDSDSGASGSIVDGLAIVQGNNSRLVQNISTEVGKTYFVTATCSGAGSARIIFVKEFVTDATLLELHFDDGETRGAFTATSTTTEIMLYSYGSGITKFDNVSVREMPVLKWAPHNLCRNSEDATASNFFKSNVTVTSVSSVTAPNGTTGVNKYEFAGAAGDNVYITDGGADIRGGVTGTFAVFAKAVSSATTIRMRIWDNGSTGAQYADKSVSADDWTLLTHEATTSSNSTTANFAIYNNSSGNASDIYVWGFHIFRSDLGGMVDNPERGDSYVPTAVRPIGANLITNGTFDTDTTGWAGLLGASLSVVNGALRVAEDGNDASTARAYQSFSTVVGKAYEVKVDYVGGTSDFGEVYINNNTNFGGALASDNSIVAGTTSTISFVATATTTYILLGAGPASEYSDYDNISVRESSVLPNVARYLPRIGHHVYNGSAWANEGLLAESEARTNVATYSNFSSGFGNARCTRTADAAVSPDGTQNASEIIETTDTGSHFISTNTTVTASVAYTLSCYFKQSSGSRSAILRTNNVGTTTYAVFDFATETITETGADTRNATVENVGNGWYRVSFTYTQNATTLSGIIVALSNSTTPSSGAPSYTGDGTSGFYVYGVQFEQAETPSSYVPTGSGSSVTRAAETFTIPSANLPWPSPNYIGSERLTGSWAVPTGYDNTVSGTATSVVATGGTTTTRCFVEIDGVDAGEVYQVTLTVNSTSVGNVAVYLRDSSTGSGTILLTQTAIPEGSTFVGHVAAASDVMSVLLVGSTGADFDVDISVREINPLSVSIAMDGAVTYADEDAFGTVTFFRWYDTSSNYILIGNDTDSTDTGEINFRQIASGTQQITNLDAYSPDIFVPFNVAMRNGSTFVGGAVDGVAATANTAVVELPDLSATDLDLAYDYMGTIGTFRVWDRDIADTGLVEATNPSLEPSLSLTFEGAFTNSFVVNDWSE